MQEGGTPPRGWKFWAKLTAPVLASILGLVSLRLLGPDIVSQEQLSEWLRPLGKWAPIGFVVALAIRPVTLLPGQLFTAVGGILFGAKMASVYALAGSFFATAIIFLLAKKLGSRMVKRFAGSNHSALVETAKRHDFKFALVTTLNPLLPTDVMIAAAAASGARFWPSVAGVLVGTVPGTLLTAQFGSSLSQGDALTTTLTAIGMVLSLVFGALLGKRMIKDFNQLSEEHAKERRYPDRQRFPAPAAASPTALG